MPPTISVLTVLRADPTEDAAEREPAPGLAELEALIERTRFAGIAVSSRVEVGEPLPPGIALAVYRIVQESLTNVVKHVGRGSCAVSVQVGDGRVTVEVADDGEPQARGEGGHGLIGIRERALMYGGTFTAGPSDGRGFTVRAVMPIESAVTR